MYTQGQHDVDVKVALAKFEVVLAQAGVVRRDKDFDELVFNLIAQLVCLGFVESNNEIAQAIGIFLDSFAGFKKLYGTRSFTTIHGSGVLIEFIEHQRNADCGGQLVNRWVITNGYQYVVGGPKSFDKVILDVGRWWCGLHSRVRRHRGHRLEWLLR